MEILELILSVLGAVVVSSFVSRFIPRISTPLVQIALGVALTFLPAFPSVKLDPELFMILFIAPLLYLEAHQIDKSMLVKTLKSSLSLAIGLVLITLVIVGFALHLAWPAIPLAAAFALGAALGPTDAVAVSSLSHEASLTDHQKGMLEGESLFNDASGVVGFQFSILAAVTGSFSLVDAAGQFALSFIGGALLGVVAAWLVNKLFETVRSLGWETTTSRILMEIFLPFLIYAAGDQLFHVSGVLAVVAFGLFAHFDRTGISPNTARTNIVSSSVWSVVSFSLNGTVFILLGMQLPYTIRSSWENTKVPNGMLLGFILLVSVLMLALRFAWVALMVATTRDPETGTRKRMDAGRWRSAAIMTFGGAKGAVTLSLMFTIPFQLSDGSLFPMRSELIFVASGVIIVTLLLANFMLPLLAPAKDDSQDSQKMANVTIEVLRRTVDALASEVTDENRRTVLPVIDSYNKRITRLRQRTGTIDEEKFQDLQIQALTWEKDYIKEQLATVQADKSLSEDERDLQVEACERMMDRIMNTLRHTEGQRKHNNALTRIGGQLRGLRHRAALVIRRVVSKVLRSTPAPTEDEIYVHTRNTQIDAIEYVIHKITEQMGNDTALASYYSALLLDYRRTESTLRSRPTLAQGAKASAQVQEARHESYTIELGVVQDMLAGDEITRAQAKQLRRNVYVMQVDADAEL